MQRLRLRSGTVGWLSAEGLGADGVLVPRPRTQFGRDRGPRGQLGQQLGRQQAKSRRYSRAAGATGPYMANGHGIGTNPKDAGESFPRSIEFPCEQLALADASTTPRAICKVRAVWPATIAMDSVLSLFCLFPVTGAPESSGVEFRLRPRIELFGSRAAWASGNPEDLE